MRLNVIDDYNQNMNNVDIADQLRGQYRPDHWLRHKMWWLAIFIWGLRVAKVNAYKIYVAMWDEENKKGRADLLGKWSHVEFVEELVYDLIFPEQPMRGSRRSLSSFSSSNNLQEEDNLEWDFSNQHGIDTFLKNKKESKITTGNLQDSLFSCCLDGRFQVTMKGLTKSSCQYCYYL